MRIDKRALWLPSIVLVVLLACSVVRAADDRVLYTRADDVVAVTGEASLRRAYTKRIELPWPDCAGKAFTCVKDVMYGQVYEVAFVEEIVTRAPDGEAMLERIDRGRLSIAVEFPVDVEGPFEDALKKHLQTLAVASYSRPQAGTRFLRGPLEQRTLRKSGLPAWVCTEFDGVRRFDVIVPGEHGERSFSRSGDVAEAACRAIASAVENELPTVYRTMPDIRSQVRREVRLAEASTLGGLTWADRLAQIPDDVTFEKRPLEEGRKTGGIRDRRDGYFIGHEGRYGEVERNVRLPPASLDVVEAPMWVARWTFETVRETFGDAPRIDRDPVESIVIAVLPITDPLMDELERSGTPLAVPQELLIERTLTVFKREATLGPDVVIKAFYDPRLWPSGGDWMILACADDGSARYGIAPFASAAEVKNPREACAAVRREIGD